jgi:RimJ/RimL family protein N-acetyltransferase
MMSCDGVHNETNAKAARVEERCNYRVVGYVMEHNALAKRAIVADDAVRWFPNESDFDAMMGWKKHSAGPGIPAEGWQ